MMNKVKIILAVVSCMILVVILSWNEAYSQGCKGGCFYLNYWNEDAVQDFIVKGNEVCIEYSVKSAGGVNCPVLKEWNGSCLGSVERQRAITETCRCCGAAGVRGQNWECKATGQFETKKMKGVCTLSS